LDPVLQQFSDYAETYSSPESALLKEINDYTNQHHSDPVMLSGHLQGKLLEMLSWMIRPKRILEIGTFTGYSAIALASGLTDDGELHTIELRPEDGELAQQYFDRSQYKKKIHLHVGNAVDIIPTLEESWDLVLIDADKPAYIQYFNLVFYQLRKNGFILADNIFFHGHALSPENQHTGGKSAAGIKAFNAFIQERTDIEKAILTIRDGLYLIRKL
jgi:caffeoyl-CoA O-methyltransferase